MSDETQAASDSGLIVTRGVTKSFGSKMVLKGIHVSIARGESLVVLGGSGAGKSVFMKHLIGLLHPDSGEVWVDGRNLAQLDRRALFDLRRRFGMSFQEGALFDSMTVFENIAFPIRRHHRNWSVAQVAARVDECLDLVDLPGTGALMPNELSGGMRRRVGFARAIALKPEILLFDEPTTGLDPVMTSVLSEVIVELRTRLKSTCITITHDLHSARRIATRAAMLYGGKWVLDAPVDAFFRHSDPLVRQFLEGRIHGPMTDGTQNGGPHA